MITVITKPSPYSPTNSAIFKITSDREGILQFRVNVYDADSNLVMFSQKYSVLPMLQNGTFFNIAPELQSFIDRQITNSTEILLEVPKILKRYQVEIFELYRDNEGVITNGDNIFLNDSFYIWNGELNRVDFTHFNYLSYVNSTGAIPAKFLNRKPRVVSTYYNETQNLYLISNVAAKVIIKLYKRPGILLGSHIIPGILANHAYRLAVSPEDLVNEYGDELFVIEGGEFTPEFTNEFGTLTTINSADFYTVEVISQTDIILSETRVFSINKTPCLENVVNLIFDNNLGGFDSLMFKDAKETLNAVRKTIESNPYQFDADGNYSQGIDGIYNPTSTIISSQVTKSFAVTTDILTDEMSTFAGNIFQAERVFVKLSNSELYPVDINETDYTANKRRLNAYNSRLSINFKITDSNLVL